MIDFICYLNDKEYIRMKPHERGVHLEIHAPSMVSMGEDASMILRSDLIERFVDYLRETNQKGDN